MSYCQPCHGQTRSGARSRSSRTLPGSSETIRGKTRPMQSGPPWCGQRLRTAKKRSPTRNTPISRPPTRTMRLVSGGKSSSLATTNRVDISGHSTVVSACRTRVREAHNGGVRGEVCVSIETSVESVPVPEPDLTPAELLARARALVPLLREEQEETERRGFYSQELHERFLDAGFYRTLQPRRFGGYEFDLPTFWRLVMTLSSGCPSAGWCFCLAAGHALQLGSLFPERTQAECFGPDGEFLAPARASPYGTAVRDGDGWTIEGTWDYCSGVPYSTHFMPVALAPELGPEATVFAVIPRSQWTMQDDWGGDVILGFRGSGSHSVVVERTWVPGHYVILDNLLDVDVSEGTVGSRLHGNPMYAGRTLGFFHGELVAIVVGTARAALDEYERIVTSRQTFVPPYMPRFHHPDFQR